MCIWLQATHSPGNVCVYVTLSQGSASTRFRCGGISSDDVITSLLASVEVEKCWESDSIWRSYGKESECQWNNDYVWVAAEHSVDFVLQ